MFFPSDVFFLYLAWPWIGLGAAVALAVVLFATDLLRSDTGVSRWKLRSVYRDS